MRGTNASMFVIDTHGLEATHEGSIAGSRNGCHDYGCSASIGRCSGLHNAGDVRAGDVRSSASDSRCPELVAEGVLSLRLKVL
eukprot:4675903-Pleurochrysis_carterae.AAC.1